MSDKYVNKEGVHIDVHEDKYGKTHTSFYDKDPSEKDHSSIHINYDTDTGKGNIKDHNGDRSEKSSTDTSCFLTTACMRYFQEKFDNNCYELTVLRWFRDNFVSQEDINHYYKTAPVIVGAISSTPNNYIIYDYIYENVVDTCVDAIERGDYDFAYKRYKNSILSLEETFARKELQSRLVKSLKNLNNSVCANKTNII